VLDVTAGRHERLVLKAALVNHIARGADQAEVVAVPVAAASEAVISAAAPMAARTRVMSRIMGALLIWCDVASHPAPELRDPRFGSTPRAETRDSTFPGNALFAGRISERKTGTPLFLEMLYKPPRPIAFNLILTADEPNDG
jgi:hypothetical protein